MNNNVTVFDQQDGKYKTGMPILRQHDEAFELVNRDTHERIGIFNRVDILNVYTNEAATILKNKGCSCVEARLSLSYCPVHHPENTLPDRLDKMVMNTIEVGVHKEVQHDFPALEENIKKARLTNFNSNLQAMNGKLFKLREAEDEVERGIKALYLELPVEVASHFHNLFFRYKTLVHERLQG